MSILKRNNEKKNKKFQRKGSNSLNKLSLFQKNDSKFSKNIIKNAPLLLIIKM